MYSSDVVQAIDSLIEERKILKHPFYVAWECGELTRDDLAVYARIYYPHVAEFPCHLEAVRAGCSDVVIKDTLNDIEGFRRKGNRLLDIGYNERN